MSNYDDLFIAYEKMISGRGFVERQDWSTVVVTGEDRVSFLHNLCSNDIKQLSTGESCEAFFADVKGKIVGHVVVLSSSDRITLVTVPDQAEALISHLDRYIIREDVQLTNATDAHAWLVVFPSEALGKWIENRSVTHLILSDAKTFAGPMVGVAATDHERAIATLVEHGLTECDTGVAEVLRIEARQPVFDVDFDGSNLPQEVDRDAIAINFNKGCYLGQETIARIDALGHVNKKVVALQFAGDSVPAIGTELTVDSNAVGMVTSSCWSPKHCAPLAMAMVRRGANEHGTQLQSDFGLATVLPTS
ncbi:MAG: glycine cleavage T C-terminal barrel domain-containing protein [Planctomycetota bacterium]